MRARIRKLLVVAFAALLGLAPTAATATDGSTEVTIRRLEEQGTSPFAPLAQTGLGNESLVLIVAGAAMLILAIVTWRLARRRGDGTQ